MRFWTRDNRLKIMAFLLAVLTWYIVNQITNYNKIISNVALEVYLPEGWAIRDKQPSGFDVTFLGTKEDLLRLDERTVRLELDLRGEEFSPVKTIRLSPRNVIHTGINARVAGVEPESVEITFGRESMKRVPVSINVTGELRPGYKMESLEFEPRTIKLFGAEDRLESIVGLQTSSLDLSGRIQSFEQRVDILPPGPEWVGRVDPTRLLVKVTISGLTVEREFPGVPVRILEEPGKTEAVWVEPPAVSVLLKARPELLDAMDASQIRAFVSLPAAENQGVVLLHVPSGVEILEIRPPRVKLGPVAVALPPPATNAAPANAEAPSP
jgi:YbbR domain-containing protein